MLKITKTISLAIKKGDIIFDINPETHSEDAAGFEVIKVDTLNNKLMLKALNENANEHYIPHINTGLFSFDAGDIDKGWFKVEVEV